MSTPERTESRKVDHVKINLDERVDSRLTTGFERYSFQATALPEIDLADVDTAGNLLGFAYRAPILISSMTGGSDALSDINLRLAEAAEERGIVMGVGSQRAAIEADALSTSFEVRRVAPTVPLLANIGAVQLNYGYGLDECRRAVDMIEASALILHFNVLQEAVQPEGDTRWAGLLARIEALATRFEHPIIAKEVGWGFTRSDLRRLRDAGVSAVDVAGAGGTSWSEVEKHRAESELQRRVAGAFVDWGTPTAEAIVNARQETPDLPVIASGGIRDGVDVAKSVALGASLAGLAGPFLRAATESTARVIEEIDVLTQTLRVAMFAVGAPDLASLRQGGRLRETGG